MKIAWFTPFCNDSAIGQIGSGICGELSERGITADIWAEELHSKNPCKTNLNVIYYNSEKLNTAQLKNYDYVIYNIGNYLPFHEEVYRVMKKFRGIVLFHDQTMSGFLCTLFNQVRYDRLPDGNLKPEELWREEYDLIFSGYQDYNKLNPVDFIAKHIDELDSDPAASLKPFVKYAKAVFTHAEFFAEIIRDNFNLPTGWAYLPVQENEITDDTQNCKDIGVIKKIIADAKKENRKIAVSTGYVNPLKRIDKLVNAISEEKELQNKICYIVIGEYNGDYADKLKKQSENEFRKFFHLTGRLSRPAMLEAIKQADICVNLRYPNSEVCSLSLLEQMYSGKPTLTINSGFYAEIPENCTLRVNIENENNEIKEVLYNLVFADKKNTEQMPETGNNAEIWVKENCNRKKYSDKFIEFIKTADKQYEICKIQQEFLKSIKTKMDNIFYDPQEMPFMISNIVNNTEYFLGTRKISG